MKMTECERNFLIEIINGNNFYFVDNNKEQSDSIDIIFASHIVDVVISSLYAEHPEEVISIFEQYSVFPVGCDYTKIHVYQSDAKKTFGTSLVPIFKFSLTK